VKNKDWEKIEKEKKAVEEIKLSVYTDMIESIIEKGYEKLNASERLQLQILLGGFNKLNNKYIS
jgi:hypothetical protein